MFMEVEEMLDREREEKARERCYIERQTEGKEKLEMEEMEKRKQGAQQRQAGLLIAAAPLSPPPSTC